MWIWICAGNCYDKQQYKEYFLFCPFAYRLSNSSILVKVCTVKYWISIVLYSRGHFKWLAKIVYKYIPLSNFFIGFWLYKYNIIHYSKVLFMRRMAGS